MTSEGGFTWLSCWSRAIISILAVTAVSQLQDEAGYGEYTYQARFISLARHVQTRAMQHTQTAGQCYQINFNIQSNPWFATPDLASTHSDCNATSAHQWVNSETQSFGATDTQEMADANLLMRFEDFTAMLWATRALFVLTIRARLLSER